MGKTILEQAQSIVYGDRQDAYGNVTDNFSNIAKLWSVVIGKDIEKVYEAVASRLKNRT